MRGLSAVQSKEIVTAPPGGWDGVGGDEGDSKNSEAQQEADGDIISRPRSSTLPPATDEADDGGGGGEKESLGGKSGVGIRRRRRRSAQWLAAAPWPLKAYKLHKVQSFPGSRRQHRTSASKGQASQGTAVPGPLCWLAGWLQGAGPDLVPNINPMDPLTWKRHNRLSA
ncbi:hypothetical protein TgHK011_004406 [Trichoderma gracile]|nr:hypothetical protein TgHK011_004406 [Trichoderma gracile]